MVVESKILVRCALQKANDTTVVAPHDWTILRLKQHLSATLPKNPDVKRQKLIYAGKCLLDDQTIGSLFSAEIVADIDTPQVFHLVYSPTVEELREERTKKTVKKPEDLGSSTTATNLRQRNTTATANNINSASVTSPNLLASSNNNGPQNGPNFLNPMLYWGQSALINDQTQPAAAADWFTMQQQMYNAYMVNYVAYMNGVYGAMYGGGGFMNPGLSAQQIGFNVVDQQQSGGGGGVEMGGSGDGTGIDGDDQQQLGAGAGQQQVQPAQQQQPALNAQGGIDDDDGRERDWLDWIYLGSRAALLTMILYFYSSIERFTFVMFCVVIMYGVNAGWFGLRQQQQQQQQQQQPQNNNNRLANNNNNNNNDHNENNNNNPAGQEGEAGAAPSSTTSAPAVTTPTTVTPSSWQVFWSTCFTFITTFFSSMIPERPPPIQPN